MQVVLSFGNKIEFYSVIKLITVLPIFNKFYDRHRLIDRDVYCNRLLKLRQRSCATYQLRGDLTAVREPGHTAFAGKYLWVEKVRANQKWQKSGPCKNQARVAKVSGPCSNSHYKF